MLDLGRTKQEWLKSSYHVACSVSYMPVLCQCCVMWKSSDKELNSLAAADKQPAIQR